ncbi:DnaJ domain-containing protein [Pelagibacterium sp. 26DY04]|uniref:DnaJ domain-containing protein n=1 Tax=Pelagibacterium sp. 26DY04 TaxID=2967130 RepID=UPI002814CA46|nr:DnaJ domain-containing protein [Pelagibacterium sp. 26DY04]WMT87387.1 DnaJ domain-containing protein [Pelagibacterium sp. 26DY04]
MTWLVLGGALAVIVLYLATLFARGEIRRLVRTLRWVVGGALLGGAGLLGARGQMLIASFLAAGGIGLLLRGRLGPIDFGSGLSSPNNASAVSSHHFDMRLDHETGEVSGTVRAGHFAGRPLAQLSAAECWALYDEVSDDPDSLALYESWLNANRAGWRDYFATEFGMDPGEEEAAPGSGPATEISGTEEAYQILGLEPGASAEAIKAAHRKLMKSVHPDAGGSAFLAARINQAKDLLLKQATATRKS